MSLFITGCVPRKSHHFHSYANILPSYQFLLSMKIDLIGSNQVCPGLECKQSLSWEEVHTSKPVTFKSKFDTCP